MKFLTILLLCNLNISVAEDLTKTELKMAQNNRIQHKTILKTVKDNKTINIYVSHPKIIDSQTQILIVMHGMNRNADRYHESVDKLLKNKNVLLVTPEFTKESFPTSFYQRGNVINKQKTVNKKEDFTYPIIDQIFNQIKEKFDFKKNSYDIFGHSAGAQFVHRMVLFYPECKIDRAISANAGYYTIPNSDYKYPYGLKGLNIALDQQKKSFSSKLIIMLGDKDTDKKQKSLRKTKEALVQGDNRVERGQNYYAQSKLIANKMQTDFNWKLVTVPNVGHKHKGMAKAAIKELSYK